jgi:3'-phosphoadenosine 5'-phosphosulfate (PAPS) 3'-phosphatase
MNYQSITELVIALAKETAIYIQHERENFSSDKVETKSKNDFVSYVDQESEKILVKALKNIVPELVSLLKKEPRRHRAKIIFGLSIRWTELPISFTILHLMLSALHCRTKAKMWWVWYTKSPVAKLFTAGKAPNHTSMARKSAFLILLNWTSH